MPAIKKNLAIFLFFLFALTGIKGVTVAFDLTKSENAGNADWVIGSSPNWTGAYSDFGAALRNLGYTTTTLTGNSITTSMLSNVDVLVLPEPQDPFTTNERTALLNFVQNGGGLFLIADHDGSDRNNNGWDSRRVYNESLLTASYFGISYDANNLYADPTTLMENPQTQITSGLSQVGMYAGCSITPSGSASCHIWLRNTSEEGLVTNTYGSGRVAAYGDSSPFDDGTGNSGNVLYDGWTDHDNAQLGVNVIQWLSQQTPSAVSFSTPVLVPTLPNINQSIEVRISIQATQSLSFAYLYWKTTGGFNPVPMTLLSGNIYKAIIPAQNLPAVVYFYILARTTGNLSGYYPTGAPTTLASFNVNSTANNDEVVVLTQPVVYPNPVSISKSRIILKAESGTDAYIYNIKGLRVKTLTMMEPELAWDGRDKYNHLCPPGLYLIRFLQKNQVTTKTMLLLP